MLNVGFDRNMVNNDKIFYNLGQGWQNSGFSGSLMIRPIMGKALPAEPTSAGTLESADELFAGIPESGKPVFQP